MSSATNSRNSVYTSHVSVSQNADSYVIYCYHKVSHSYVK